LGAILNVWLLLVMVLYFWALMILMSFLPIKRHMRRCPTFSPSSRGGAVIGTLLEAGRASNSRRGKPKRFPFRYFKTSPEIIRLAVMMYVRFPLSLRNLEDLLHERGIDISWGAPSEVVHLLG
jgi:hypothetical protein